MKVSINEKENEREWRTVVLISITPFSFFNVINIFDLFYTYSFSYYKIYFFRSTSNFFLPGALLTGGAQSFRNATVIVSSEKCQLLRLFQSKFQTFIKTSDLFSVSMMKSFQDTQNERNKSNSNAISKERSRKGLDVVTATNVTDSVTDSATDSVTNSVTDSETKNELVKVDDVNETVNEGKDVDQKVDDEKEEKKEKEEKEGVPKTSIIPIANDFSIASPPPPPPPLNLNGTSKSERSLFS